MASCHTVLLMATLFRLGSGAGGLPPVPTHEPNFPKFLFDKTTVQDGILTKNNFEAGNITDDNNKKKMFNELSSPTPSTSTTTYFYDVYTVLHSLVFPGQTGHHDFHFIFTTTPTPISVDDECKPRKPQQGLLERHQYSTSARSLPYTLRGTSRYNKGF